jgi:peptidoglycan/LPS O-acetylase OafA/YrhL
MFDGGYVVLSLVCTVLVLGGAFSNSGPVAWLLRRPVLVYLGQRSYALYLWHMPIGAWLRWLPPLEQAIAAGVLSLLASELSYRLVERPALRLKQPLSSPQVAKQTTQQVSHRHEVPSTPLGSLASRLRAKAGG